MAQNNPPTEMNLRDFFAWNASQNEIERFRNRDLHANFTPEQARYRFADAMLAARAEATKDVSWLCQ